MKAETLRVIPIPAPADAREPQVAVDTSGGVCVAFGAGNAVYGAVSREGGRSYAAPVKVGEAGHLALGMRRGPRIALAGKTISVTAIYGEQGRGQDGDLLAWRSMDGGRTWKGPVKVNDVPGAAREGLHGMAASRDGTLACVWLDLRSRRTEIFAALSRDGGATWGQNRLVYRSPDGSVCECCHPSAAYDARGRLLVMWRNSLGGARDMYLCASRDGGGGFTPAQKLGEGTWPLRACPMDGGALAVARDGSVHTFWRRGGEMFACVPGSPERRIGGGEQGWVAAGPDGIYRVWLERRPGALLVLPPGEGRPTRLAAEADNPVVAAAPGGKAPVVLAWTERSAAGIRSAALRP